MFTALARLAHRPPQARRGRRRRCSPPWPASSAARVADRLDPYGADDPRHRGREGRPGRRGARARAPASNVVALVQTPRGVAARRAAQGRPRWSATLRADRDVGRVTSFTSGGPALVRTRRALHLPRGDASSRGDDTDDEARGRAPREAVAGTPGVKLGGDVGRQPQVNEQVSEDLARAEMLAFPILFAAVVAVLPQPGGRAAAAAGRAACRSCGTFLGLRLASERRVGLGVRPEPGDRPRARAGDRLQPVHRLALPRGAREASAPGAEAMRAHARHRGAHGALQLADGGRRAGVAARVPPALPVLDGPRRDDGRAHRRRRRADRAARRCWRCSGTRVNALAPERLQRARERERAARSSGFWYRLSRVVMRRPGPIAAIASAGAADRARAARSWASSSPRSTPSVLPETALGPPGRRRDQARLPARPDGADRRSSSRTRRPARARALRRAAAASCRASPRSTPPQRLDGDTALVDVVSEQAELLDDAARSWCATCATRRPASRRWPAARRPSSSTCRRASPTTCRWRWRSSWWPRWSCCS